MTNDEIKVDIVAACREFVARGYRTVTSPTATGNWRCATSALRDALEGAMHLIGALATDAGRAYADLVWK